MRRCGSAQCAALDSPNLTSGGPRRSMPSSMKTPSVRTGDGSTTRYSASYEMVTKTKILDYGAGDGAFLRRLPGRWHKHAVEVSATQRRVLEAQGVTASGVDARLGHGRFDVITMFQVLEHMANYAAVLDLCRAALLPGGRIFISVPEGERLREWEDATGLPDMPPFHVNQWTRESLRMALTAAGFVGIRFAADSFSAANIAMLLGNGLRAEVLRPRSVVSRVWTIKDRRLRRAAFTAAALLYAPKLLRLALRSPDLGRGVILLAQARRPENRYA